jgi:hypothetical protein
MKVAKTSASRAHLKDFLGNNGIKQGSELHTAALCKFDATRLKRDLELEKGSYSTN